MASGLNDRPERQRWPLAAIIVVSIVSSLLVVGGAALALTLAADRSAPTSSSEPQARDAKAAPPAKALPKPSAAPLPNKPTTTIDPAPQEPGPALVPAEDPATPPQAPPGVVLALPAEPPCPTGTVLVTAPTSTDIHIEPSYEATMRRLGMADRLAPTFETSNVYSYAGGTLVNQTSANVRVSQTPTVILTGVPQAIAFGSHDSITLAPGQSAPWTATGQQVFAIGSVTGYQIDLTYVKAHWGDGESALCPAPALGLG